MDTFCYICIHICILSIEHSLMDHKCWCHFKFQMYRKLYNRLSTVIVQNRMSLRADEPISIHFSFSCSTLHTPHSDSSQWANGCNKQPRSIIKYKMHCSIKVHCTLHTIYIKGQWLNVQNI